MLRLIKDAITVDLIFGGKSRRCLGAFTANDSWQCPLMYCSIWTQFGSSKEGAWGHDVLRASSFIPGHEEKKKKSRPVINTSCGGGETEMLPQQLVCYCMVQDFCLKHEIKFKERAGWWWWINCLICCESLFLYWKESRNFTGGELH